ncbi:MAG: LacI family DNA-binding transcriptional regulator [Phycisphaeraceae bacterium]
MSEPRTPSIYAIAREAGVSHATVARILNGRGIYRRPTDAQRAEHIRRLAAQMGYRPNAAARATASGRFGSVALLLSTMGDRSNLPQPLLNGIHDALAAQGMHLTVTRLPDEKLTDAGYVPKILREVSADGLLIDYTHGVPAAMIELIKQHRLPAIWLNTKRDTDAVYADDLGLGRLATEHLLALGHRRIGYLGRKPAPDDNQVMHYSQLDRLRGHELAMRDAGLEPEVRRPALHRARQSRRDLLHAWLREPEPPTALLTYRGTDAQTALFVAQELGLAVPGDLSVMALGSPTTDWVADRWWVTSASPDERALGERAVALLEQKIAQPHREQPAVAIPGHVHQEKGNTCAPTRGRGVDGSEEARPASPAPLGDGSSK